MSIISPEKIEFKDFHRDNLICSYLFLNFHVCKTPDWTKSSWLIEFPGFKQFNTKIGQKPNRVDIAKGLEKLLQTSNFKLFIFTQIFKFI